MKPTKTWILIADAGSARIVENNGPGKGLHQVGGQTFSQTASETYSDRQGRAFQSTTPMRHKLEPHSSADKAEASFAKILVDTLATCHRNDCFDRLMICASPDMLSHLRKQLPGPIKSDVIAEVPKNLTHVPINALPDHFDNVLVI